MGYGKIINYLFPGAMLGDSGFQKIREKHCTQYQCHDTNPSFPVCVQCPYQTNANNDLYWGNWQMGHGKIINDLYSSVIRFSKDKG